MNIIGLLDEPSAGEYFFDEPVHKLREKQKSEMHKNYIGFIFQAYHLIDELTVYENIETPLLYKGVAASQRKSMVAELLDRFNMVAKRTCSSSSWAVASNWWVLRVQLSVSLNYCWRWTYREPSEQGKANHGNSANWNDEGITIIQVTHSRKKMRGTVSVLLLLPMV